MVKNDNNSTLSILAKSAIGVISSLLLAAVVFIFSFVVTISTDLRLIQQANLLQGKELSERFDRIDNYITIVSENTKKLSKLEWDLENHKRIHEDDDKR